MPLVASYFKCMLIVHCRSELWPYWSLVQCHGGSGGSLVVSDRIVGAFELRRQSRPHWTRDQSQGHDEAGLPDGVRHRGLGAGERRRVRGERRDGGGRRLRGGPGLATGGGVNFMPPGLFRMEHPQ